MKFVADDGKVFENYDECEEYEKEQKNSYIVEDWRNYILMFDDEGTLISIDTNVDEITAYLAEIAERILGEVFYLIVNEKCNWKPIRKYFYEEYGIALPENTGTYRWNSDEWISLDEEIKKLNNHWKSLNFKVILQAS